MHNDSTHPRTQTPPQKHTNKKPNKNRLVDAEPKKLYCPLPVLYVTGVLAKDRRRAQVECFFVFLGGWKRLLQ